MLSASKSAVYFACTYVRMYIHMYICMYMDTVHLIHMYIQYVRIHGTYIHGYGTFDPVKYKYIRIYVDILLVGCL